MASPLRLSAVAIDDHRGARILAVRDASLPLVCINLRFATGSRDDPPGRSGMAHILEHLLLAGTAATGRGDHVRRIQALGGLVNATASTDWTKFWHVVSSDLVANVFAMEVERLADVDWAITEANLAAEKEIVLGERLHRMTNVAYGAALERLVGAAYPAGSPYARLPIGLADTVSAVTAAECRQQFATHYTASRACIAVVGDVDPAWAVDQAQRLTATLSDTGETGAGPTLPAQPAVLQRLCVPTTLKPKVYLGYLLPSEADWGFDLSRLAATLLGRGSGARLSELLIRRHHLAADVSVKTMGRASGPSLGVIEVVPAEGVRTRDLVDRLDEALGEPPSPPEIQRAKAIHRAAVLADYDSIASRCDGLSLSLQLHGSAEPYLELENRIVKAGTEDVAAGLASWHPGRRRVELAYVND